MEHPQEHSGVTSETVHLPAPTAWPFVLAFGLTLVFAGMVTNVGVSVLGGLLALCACVGWFRQVLPHEQHETIPVEFEEFHPVSTRTQVARIEADESHRATLPVETYSVMAGVKGGIAGGIAMIFPALLYGILSHHSIWYPVNLLGGAGVANWRNPTTADIAAFHWQGLIVATIIHAVTCLLVGLLYGAMLPMLPRRPVLLGGLIAPLLWTGLLHSTLSIVNPVLAAHVDWGWFVVSQVAFGVVAGIVVARQERIRTAQNLPFLARIGLETPGLMHRDDEEGPQK
jgi:hypothetical protein